MLNISWNKAKKLFVFIEKMIIRHAEQFMLLAWIRGKERSQKLATTLVIHHENSIVVITLPFQIFAEHISIHEINCKIDKFVWRNRSLKISLRISFAILHIHKYDLIQK